MVHWLLIGAAGALGTVGRAALGALLVDASWPVYTWLANALGSFGIAVAAELLADVEWLGVAARPVVATGLLGGFTTYSAFNLETLRLMETEQWGRAAAYAFGTLLSCLVAGALGLYAARSLHG